MTEKLPMWKGKFFTEMTDEELRLASNNITSAIGSYRLPQYAQVTLSFAKPLFAEYHKRLTEKVKA